MPDAKRPLSRRALLKGASVTALGVSLANLSVGKAQDAPSPDVPLPLALQRFDLGDMQVTAFQEAALALEPAMWGGGAPEGAVSELLGEYNLPTDAVSATVNVMLLERDGERILIDTGTGQNLVPTLEALGVDPSSVNAVVLSHYHGDHVGGMSMDGTLTFPNAMYHFPQAEWDFLQSAPSDNEGAQAALNKLQPAVDAGQISYFGGGQEVVSGVQAVNAFGHTPGHTIFTLGSGDASLLHIADTATHALISPLRPEWAFAFDANPEQAAATRREVLSRAANDGTKIFAYHFAFPGLGYVAQEGDAFRFTPAP